MLLSADPRHWLGDKGYIGNNMLTAFRKPEGGELPDWQKEFNKQINKIRYVIEQVIANFNENHELPNQLPEHALSAVAVPILYAGRSAGCLLVASTQPDYFDSPALLDLIQEYATLLTLAFHPEDFYELECIALQIMPSFQVQQSYLSTFRQRIMTLLKKAARDQRSMSYNEAEQHVWGQIEEELLQLQQFPGSSQT